MRKASSGEAGAGADAGEERALFMAGSSGRGEGKVGEMHDLGPGAGIAPDGDRTNSGRPFARAGYESAHRLKNRVRAYDVVDRVPSIDLGLKLRLIFFGHFKLRGGSFDI